MRKLVLIGLVALGALAAAGAACAAPKVRIGVSLPAADRGWMGGANWWARKATDDWKAKDSDLSFVFAAADSPKEQAADIEDMMVKGIKAIVVFPFDLSLTAVVEKAYRKDIYTVVLDRGVSKPVYDVWLKNDDVAFARQGMGWVCKELKGRGNVVLIEGRPSSASDIRVRTAVEVAKTFPRIRILDSLPGNGDRQKAQEVMQRFLRKYPHIDAVYTADDDMLQGALQAYADSKRQDIGVWMGGGGMKEIVKKIIDGDPMVRADATYPPDVIATGVSLAVLGVRGRTFEGFYQKKLPSSITLSSEMITKENAQDYYFPDAPF